jgi:hypothetical protein
MSASDGGEKIDTMLRHLGSGHDLQDFPGTTAEKLGLMRTAGARGLIVWRKARGRYELTQAGWRKVMPRRGLGLATRVVSTTIGAAIGAGALAVLWLPADTSHRAVGRQPTAPVSRPVDANGGPHTPLETASASSAAPGVQEYPAPTLGSPTEPAKVAEQVVPEEPRAEAAPTVTAQAIKKSRHKTSKTRSHRTWAWANPYRDDRYSGFGRFR